MSTTQVYAVGQNRYGEIPKETRNTAIGYKHASDKSLTKLESFPCKNITKIICGNYYTFFIDNEETVWSSGSNHHGQQGFKSINNIKTHYLPQIAMQNTITTSKICVNHSGHATFYIATDNQVYATGYNIFHQLGISSTEDQHIPVSIPSLNYKNIIDCKSAYRYSLALSKPTLHQITSQFCRENVFKNSSVPDGIIQLICMLHGFHCVYSTGWDTTGGAGHANSDHENETWKAIETFENKNMIKIASGARHSMFLESNGVLWASGENDYGQLGLGHFNDTAENLPVEIEFFKSKGIKIKDIKCGMYHNLALDDKSNIYGWGCNDCGQCTGNWSFSTKINEPTLITFFKDKKLEIECMDCGARHSYVKTKDGKYYIFGDDEFGESLGFNADCEEPICVNDFIYAYYRQCRNMKIESISLGHNDTFVILSYKDFLM